MEVRLGISWHEGSCWRHCDRMFQRLLPKSTSITCSYSRGGEESTHMSAEGKGLWEKENKLNFYLFLSDQSKSTRSHRNFMDAVNFEKHLYRWNFYEWSFFLFILLSYCVCFLLLPTILCFLIFTVEIFIYTSLFPAKLCTFWGHAQSASPISQHVIIACSQGVVMDLY